VALAVLRCDLLRVAGDTSKRLISMSSARLATANSSATKKLCLPLFGRQSQV
jgi:hypothetical protein